VLHVLLGRHPSLLVQGENGLHAGMQLGVLLFALILCQLMLLVIPVVDPDCLGACFRLLERVGGGLAII
jgi:hypothetical protein